MMSIAKNVQQLWGLVSALLDKLAPIADLAARIYVARVFFLSGLNKIQDWDTTMYLFSEEYQVPLLSPQLAAVMGTGGELVLSVMLVIGLFTRFSASGLFVLNIVAVVSYYSALSNSAVAIHDHIEWGIILGLLLVTSVRQLTFDHLVIRRFC